MSYYESRWVKMKHGVIRVPSSVSVSVLDHMKNGQVGAKPEALSPYFIASPGQPPARDFSVHDDRNWHIERGELRHLKQTSGLTYDALSEKTNIPSTKLRRWLKPGKSDFDLLPANKFVIRDSLRSVS